MKRKTDDDDMPPENQEDVKRIPPKYQIHYSETCLFEETEDILPFIKRNYKASIYVGFMANKMHHVNVVFDNGAGTNRVPDQLLRMRPSRTSELSGK